ncbi:MAG: hypothetical protein R3194_05460, partial [Limnobacter sp.]|nr:hypothetical protein [Limnobacter sp.]
MPPLENALPSSSRLDSIKRKLLLSTAIVLIIAFGPFVLLMLVSILPSDEFIYSKFLFFFALLV